MPTQKQMTFQRMKAIFGFFGLRLSVSVQEVVVRLSGRSNSALNMANPSEYPCSSHSSAVACTHDVKL